MTKISVATGNGYDRAGRVDTRTCEDAFVDGALETERRPAHIANGGEPAQERVCSLGACYQVEVADVPRKEGCWRRPHQHSVPVHIDQARHQSAPATGDNFGVGEALDRYWVERDFFDRVAANENIHWGA